MYTIETRELTADEASRTRPCIRDAIEGVILLVMIGIGLGFAAFGLGVLLQWVLEKFGILVGAWLPWSLGTATSVVIAGLLLFFFAFRTHRPVGLQIGTTVESIAVEGARAVRVGGEEDEEPLVVLDIGGGKLLFLTGQWMQDPQVFAPDGASGYFPAESFTIVRHADTGTVLKLEVRGKRLNRIPEVALDETGLTIYPLESFKPSVILNGTIGPLLAQPT